ncbi:hypothetical protein DFH09DRAFT_1436966, partial [Mycena vulgaris]
GVGWTAHAPRAIPEHHTPVTPTRVRRTPPRRRWGLRERNLRRRGMVGRGPRQHLGATTQQQLPHAPPATRIAMPAHAPRLAPPYPYAVSTPALRRPRPCPSAQQLEPQRSSRRRNRGPRSLEHVSPLRSHPLILPTILLLPRSTAHPPTTRRARACPRADIDIARLLLPSAHPRCCSSKSCRRSSYVDSRCSSRGPSTAPVRRDPADSSSRATHAARPRYTTRDLGETASSASIDSFGFTPPSSP